MNEIYIECFVRARLSNTFYMLPVFLTLKPGAWLSILDNRLISEWGEIARQTAGKEKHEEESAWFIRTCTICERTTM